MAVWNREMCVVCLLDGVHTRGIFHHIFGSSSSPDGTGLCYLHHFGITALNTWAAFLYGRNENVLYRRLTLDERWFIWRLFFRKFPLCTDPHLGKTYLYWTVYFPIMRFPHGIRDGVLLDDERAWEIIDGSYPRQLPCGFETTMGWETLLHEGCKQAAKRLNYQPRENRPLATVVIQ